MVATVSLLGALMCARDVRQAAARLRCDLPMVSLLGVGARRTPLFNVHEDTYTVRGRLPYGCDQRVEVVIWRDDVTVYEDRDLFAAEDGERVTIRDDGAGIRVANGAVHLDAGDYFIAVTEHGAEMCQRNGQVWLEVVRRETEGLTVGIKTPVGVGLGVIGVVGLVVAIVVGRGQRVRIGERPEGAE